MKTLAVMGVIRKDGSVQELLECWCACRGCGARGVGRGGEWLAAGRVSRGIESSGLAGGSECHWHSELLRNRLAATVGHLYAPTIAARRPPIQPDDPIPRPFGHRNASCGSTRSGRRPFAEGDAGAWGLGVLWRAWRMASCRTHFSRNRTVRPGVGVGMPLAFRVAHPLCGIRNRRPSTVGHAYAPTIEARRPHIHPDDLPAVALA